MHTTPTRRAGLKQSLIAGLTISALALSGLGIQTPALAQPGNNDTGGTGTTQPAPTYTPLTVRITRVDRLGQNLKEGSRLVFDVRVVSANKHPINVIAGESNLDNIERCNWPNLPPAPVGQYTCNPKVEHVITAEDVARGSYTPYANFSFTTADGQTIVTPTVTGTTITIPSTPPPAAPEPFVVTKWERVDTYGDAVKAGQLLKYTITVQNKSGQSAWAWPVKSNLFNFETNTEKRCRSQLQPDATFTCTELTYRVTAEDVQRGSFTPWVKWHMTRDGATRLNPANIIREGGEVRGPTVRVVPGAYTWDDPVTHPTDRVDGVPITLAEKGRDEYFCHRIPALTTNTQGWLLASWDARPGDFNAWEPCNDAPNANNIVQRISKDGGKSWEPYTYVARGKSGPDREGYSDPSYVVDRETGDIFMFFLKSYDQGFAGSRPGVDPNARNVIHAAVVKSTDGGLTYGEPRIITADITPPDRRAHWDSRFAASGEGIQKQYAPHKGRLIQQFTIRNRDGGTHIDAVSVYSDDHGETWKVGKPFGHGMDENKVAELSNGDLLVNSRRTANHPGRRFALSKDGGETYGPVMPMPELTDPRNNAGFTRAYPDAPMGSPEAKILLFTNAKHPSVRENGHVTISFDDGRTWSMSKQFEDGEMPYSTITPVRDPATGTAVPGKYGILYEKHYYAMRYMQVSLEWLDALMLQIDGESRELHRGVNKVVFTVRNRSNARVERVAFTPDPIPGITWSDPHITIPAIEPGAVAKVTLYATVTDRVLAGEQVLKARVDAGNKFARGSFIATHNPAAPVRDEQVEPTPTPSGPAVPSPSPSASVVPSPSPNATARPTPQPPTGNTNPQPSPSVPIRPAGMAVERLAGASRVETAVKLSETDFKHGAKTVVIARADGYADSVAGVALAEALDAPVLLTQPDSLHTAVATEVKRLQPQGGRVVILGGEVAISKQVEGELTALGAKTERLAGLNRADTAVAVAQSLAALGKAKQTLVADGSTWEDSLVAGPAAAKVDGVVLLTNGAQLAPETAAYLKHVKGEVTTIGSNAQRVLPGKAAVVGDTPSVLSVAVAKAFFPEPKAVGFATSADFADALTGGVHIGRKSGPLLLVTDPTSRNVTEWVKAATSLRQAYVYGGEARVTPEQIDQLIK